MNIKICGFKTDRRQEHWLIAKLQMTMEVHHLQRHEYMSPLLDYEPLHKRDFDIASTFGIQAGHIVHIV